MEEFDDIAEELLKDGGLDLSMSEFNYGCSQADYHVGCDTCRLGWFVNEIDELFLSWDIDQLRNVGSRLSPYAVHKISGLVSSFALLVETAVQNLVGDYEYGDHSEYEDEEDDE